MSVSTNLKLAARLGVAFGALAASAQELARTAEQLERLVARFRVTG